MRPYGVKMSQRPGCSCCSTRHFHCYKIGRAPSQNVKRAKRSAKKIERQGWKRDNPTQDMD